MRDIVFLLEKGEERVIEAVQNKTSPLTTALEIARAKHDDESLGDMLEEAYKTGQLKGHQITEITQPAVWKFGFGMIRHPGIPI